MQTPIKIERAQTDEVKKIMQTTKKEVIERIEQDPEAMKHAQNLMKGVSSFSAKVHKGMTEKKKKQDEDKYSKQKEVLKQKVTQLSLHGKAPSEFDTNKGFDVTDHIKTLYSRKTVGMKKGQDLSGEKYNFKKGLGVPSSYQTMNGKK